MTLSNQTVYIVDDDEAVRDALRMLLSAADLKVETYASASAFLKDYRPIEPGCLVLDIRMAGMSGLELQEELYKRRIRIPIIFLTGHANVAMAVRALKKGAYDFVEKPLESQRLILAVLNALRFNEEQRRRSEFLAGAPPTTDDDREQRLRQLSDREREVLGLVLKGAPSKTIAQELSISVKTVEFHRARIREKLQVNSLADLIRLFGSN